MQLNTNVVLTLQIEDEDILNIINTVINSTNSCKIIDISKALSIELAEGFLAPFEYIVDNKNGNYKTINSKIVSDLASSIEEGLALYRLEDVDEFYEWLNKRNYSLPW